MSNQEPETIGAIKVSRMVWTATILSLGAIFICWYNCGLDNPSIMSSALEYPYTIILRVGVMYSLFILFLVNLFIKWWLDSSQMATHTKKDLILSVICLASYALFISTIDRKRINYNIAEWSVFVAAVTNFFAVRGIYKNMSTIRSQNPYFIGYLSWNLKRTFNIIFCIGMLVGLLIYLGQIDIYYKNITEYIVVVSTYLFYWTFAFDFSKYKMDIDRMAKLSDSDQQYSYENRQ